MSFQCSSNVISARMMTAHHCGFGSIEQSGQGFGAFRLRGADAHGQRNPIAPPAEVRSSGEAGQNLRMTCKHGRRAFVRNDQKLVFAPSSQVFRRPQPMRQRAFHFLEHGLASAGAVRFAGSRFGFLVGSTTTMAGRSFAPLSCAKARFEWVRPSRPAATPHVSIAAEFRYSLLFCRWPRDTPLRSAVPA